MTAPLTGSAGLRARAVREIRELRLDQMTRYTARGETDARERAGLADVLLQSLPGTGAELTRAARRHWHPETTRADVAAALRWIEGAGKAHRGTRGRWVRG